MTPSTQKELVIENCMKDPEIEIDEPVDVENMEIEIESNSQTRDIVRIPREVKNLETENNPAIEMYLSEIQEKENDTSNIDGCAFITEIDEITHPITFQNSWWCQDSDARKGWRKVIQDEFNNMVGREVWKRVRREDVLAHLRIIGTKWVFRKKTEGKYRARLCALGYTQIPGIDYHGNFAPVVKDLTLRLVITLMIRNKWT